MKARDIFGIIVRTVGLCAVLYSIWNLAFGVIMVFGLFDGGSQTGSVVAYFTFGVPALIVGILLMLLARPIVRVCYPDNKDDSDA
jgi:hypothetical protein